MGKTTIQLINKGELFTRVREEVDRLEFCLGDLDSGWNLHTCNSPDTELLTLMQEVSKLAVEFD